ncbi:probable serine/threonine-protein kinase PBL11 [Argentina anserina]|uniref:probable serine/threonine-protein kinase PBL11 n=1 Tax=Argentina anserina TaxID=57926 RepID=UPI00217674C6|nr:probable serine/threonine-protein kinase PBL11 [Potentilla anserina]
MGNCFGARVKHYNSQPVSKQPSPAETTIDMKGIKQGGLAAGRKIKMDDSNKESSGTVRAIHVSEDHKKNSETETHKLPCPDPSTIGKIVKPNLKEFTFAALKKATRDFKPDTILGEGGFGRVFKGWVDENTYAPSRAGIGMAVAVKKSNADSYQGQQEWEAEVNFLGKYLHPNLVKLLGYCCEEDQFLLVYEYMQKGSLENHLFRKGQERPLSWDLRLKIAIGAARGLAFLHTSEKVIYRDFKASNILLDPDYNAKLSDFGLAKLGPSNGNSHVTTRIIGTYGYAAPEYVATGHLYVKSDVYGFGVVLLEMLTGRRALDTNRPAGEHNLVDWARPSLLKKKELKRMMDPKLGDQYSLKGAFQAAELINKCLESDPKDRPSMEEVLVVLERVNAIKEKPKGTKPNDRRKVETSARQQYNNYHNKSPIHQKNVGSGVPYQARAH